MSHTWFKSLAEDSRDVHVMTSVNVIQMLSSQTCLALIYPSYTGVLTWVVLSETSPSSFTSCSCNTETSTSCICCYHTDGHSKETTNCSCSAESINWKCHKWAQSSTYCHLPINQSQEAPDPASSDETQPPLADEHFMHFQNELHHPPFALS